MVTQDLSTSLREQIQTALAHKTPVQIVGGQSKAFYGTPASATTLLDVSAHSGILAYEPSELMLKVRAGTSLASINSLLAAHGQMLGFEPPLFGEQATIGGTIACGFSGPRRPFAGSARDFVLGCSIINGLAEELHFGGQVMKNVAGFDVSRLMVGALGQLGVLLDISLRLLPLPDAEISLAFACADANAAIALMQQWQGRAWPMSALAYDGQRIFLRLSGAEHAIRAAAKALGGDEFIAGQDFWRALREQRLDYFRSDLPLWRISIAPATPMLALPGQWFVDWGGAQRWLLSTATADTIHAQVQAQQGHALLFRAADKSAWRVLEPGLLALSEQLRNAFDPYRLFNPSLIQQEL